MLLKETKFSNENQILAYALPLVTESVTLKQGLGEDENGRKIAKAGTIIPSNDAKAKGILLSDIDTTDGDVEASIIIEGYVYEEKLPAKPSAEAVTAMKEIKYVVR